MGHPVHARHHLKEWNVELVLRASVSSTLVNQEGGAWLIKWIFMIKETETVVQKGRYLFSELPMHHDCKRYVSAFKASLTGRWLQLCLGGNRTPSLTAKAGPLSHSTTSTLSKNSTCAPGRKSLRTVCLSAHACTSLLHLTSNNGCIAYVYASYVHPSNA